MGYQISDFLVRFDDWNDNGIIWTVTRLDGSPVDDEQRKFVDGWLVDMVDFKNNMRSV
jgi:hypothetical protein